MARTLIAGLLPSGFFTNSLTDDPAAGLRRLRAGQPVQYLIGARPQFSADWVFDHRRHSELRGQLTREQISGFDGYGEAPQSLQDGGQDTESCLRSL